MARRGSTRAWESVAALVALVVFVVLVVLDAEGVPQLLAATVAVALVVAQGARYRHSRPTLATPEDELVRKARGALVEAYRDVLARAKYERSPRRLRADSQLALDQIALWLADSVRDLAGPDTRALDAAVAFLDSPEAPELLARLMLTAGEYAPPTRMRSLAKQHEDLPRLLAHAADRAMAVAVIDEPPAIAWDNLQTEARGGLDEPLREFTSRLRDDVLVRVRASRLTLSAGQSPVRLDDLFVEPTVIDLATDERVGVTRLARSVTRGLIVGPPGSGKSTLLVRIAQMLAEDDSAPAPLLLAARDLVPHPGAEPLSLEQAIERAVEVTLRPHAPDGAISALLARGELVSLIDGLDEVAPPSRRALAVQLEDAVARHPSARVLVTARDASLASACPLEVFGLEPFGRDQVVEYAERRLAIAGATSNLHAEQREALQRHLAQSVDPVVATPLLVALACEIFVHSGQVPRTELDLYEQAARLLLAEWDRSRDLYAPSSREAALRPALEEVAYRLLCDFDLRGGVTMGTLVTTIADGLAAAGGEHRAEARATALELVEAFSRRRGLLVEIGSTMSGEPIFQFLTAGFLEFFAASYLVRTVRSAHDLNSELVPHLLGGEWNGVALLGYELWARSHGRGGRVEEAAEPVADLRALMKGAPRSDAARLLPVAGGAFARITLPAPLASDLGESLLGAAMDDVAVGGGDPTRAGGEAALGAALAADDPNRVELARAAERWLDRANRDPGLCSAAVQVIANLDTYCIASGGRGFRAAYWTDVSARILAAVPDAVALGAAADFTAAYDLVTHGAVPLESLIEAHDRSSIFLERRPVGASLPLPSVAERLLQWACSGSKESWPSATGVGELAKLGHRFGTDELPVTIGAPRPTRTPVLASGAGAPDPHEWPPGALWAVLAVTCVYTEAALADERLTAWVRLLGDNRSPVARFTISLVRSLLTLGSDVGWLDDPLVAILTAHQRLFLIEWTRGTRRASSWPHPPMGAVR